METSLPICYHSVKVNFLKLFNVRLIGKMLKQKFVFKYKKSFLRSVDSVIWLILLRT